LQGGLTSRDSLAVAWTLEVGKLTGYCLGE
jgi:hypothetical protein